MLLPYFVLMSLNTADVRSGAEALSETGSSAMSVLGCIEHSGIDLDTDAHDGNEQDTASKTPTLGDAVVDCCTIELLPGYSHNSMTPHTEWRLLEGVCTTTVPPPDRVPTS